MLSTIITGIVSMGIDSVVTQVVRASAPEAMKFGTKVLTKIGSMAISYAIGKKVTEYIKEDIDDMAKGLTTAKDTIIEANATVVNEPKNGEE